MKKDEDQKSEWEFKIQTNTEEIKPIEVEKKPSSKRREMVKEVKLELDDESVKTLQALHERRDGKQKQSKPIIKKDIIFATFDKRLMAQGIDAGVIYGLFLASKILTPKIFAILDNINQSHSAEFFFSPIITKNILLVGILLILYFCSIVLPLFISKATIGMNTIGLSIEDNLAIELKLSKIFMREFVFKPLSIILIFGPMMAFSNKKQLTLHDILAGTYIVEKQ